MRPLQAFILCRQLAFTQCVHAGALSLVMPAGAELDKPNTGCFYPLSEQREMFLPMLKTKTHWFMQWSLEQPTNWAMHEAQPAE